MAKYINPGRKKSVERKSLSFAHETSNHDEQPAHGKVACWLNHGVTIIEANCSRWLFEYIRSCADQE